MHERPGRVGWGVVRSGTRETLGGLGVLVLGREGEAGEHLLDVHGPIIVLGQQLFGDDVEGLTVVVERVALVVDAVVRVEPGPDGLGDVSNAPPDVVGAEVILLLQAQPGDEFAELVDPAVDQAQAGKVDPGSVPGFGGVPELCLGGEEDGVDRHPAGHAVGVGVRGLFDAVMPRQQVIHHLAEALDVLQLPGGVLTPVAQRSGKEADLVEGGETIRRHPVHHLLDDEPGVVLDLLERRRDQGDVLIGVLRHLYLIFVLHEEGVLLVEPAGLEDQPEGRFRCRATDRGREEVDHLPRQSIRVELHTVSLHLFLSCGLGAVARLYDTI